MSVEPKRPGRQTLGLSVVGVRRLVTSAQKELIPLNI
jgi:hypothetical protein